MGKVHVIGLLRNLCAALADTGAPSMDAGPILGSPPGGPYVETAAFRAAVEAAPGMTVLVRDNGPIVEVCTVDGDVLASVPTV